MQENEFSIETIAVLGGGGDLGGGLALRFARAGYHVLIGSREAARAAQAAEELRGQVPDGAGKIEGFANREAAEKADLVVLAVPYASQKDTLAAVAETLAGKILVCATVPLVPPKVARVQLPQGGSAGQEAQAQLGESVQVVSAFQNVAAAHLREDGPVDCDVLVCGNNVAAREAVIALIARCGMVAHHAGPIDNAAAAEALTSVLIGLNKRYKAHTGIRITGLPDAI